MSSTLPVTRCVAALLALVASAAAAQSPQPKPSASKASPASKAVTPAAASTTRDSAGIRIIENARPTWTVASAWKLSAKPVLVIGPRADSAYIFARVGAATRLSDGRIVVAERRDLQLRIFDSTGKHLKTVGQKGSKPGQFTDIGIVTRLPGDSLAVESAQYSSIFGPDGQFARQVTYGPFAPDQLQSPFVAVLGRFDDGSAILGDLPAGRRGGRGATHWADSSTLILVDATGALIREVDRVPSVSFGAAIPAPVRLTFGPELVQASAKNHMYLGFGDQYTVTEYDSTWAITRIIRRAWKPQPITTATITTYVDAWMTLWSTDKGPVRERDRLARLNATFPDALPAFIDLLASPSGELWLRDPELAGAATCACLTNVVTAPSKWSVFDANGHWLGRVEMPLQFRPAEVGRDYVLGSQTDAKGVVSVVMYRVIKPR